VVTGSVMRTEHLQWTTAFLFQESAMALQIAQDFPPMRHFCVDVSNSALCHIIHIFINFPIACINGSGFQPTPAQVQCISNPSNETVFELAALCGTSDMVRNPHLLYPFMII
jgi:hypothetical protein